MTAETYPARVAQVAGALRDWATVRCPHFTPARCRLRARGKCAFTADTFMPCTWAEQGPILCAPKPIFDEYLRLRGGPWWTQRPKYQTAATPPPAVKTAPASKRLCPCGNPLPPRRRLCDPCRRKARKETVHRYYEDPDALKRAPDDARRALEATQTHAGP